MKRNILGLISLALLILSISNINAQNRIKKDNISIELDKIAKIGDSLNINMRINKSGPASKSRKAIELKPVLIYGSIERDLPIISLKGRSNYQEYRRHTALMSKTQKLNYTEPYIVIKDYRKNTKNINYSVTIPFEPWMAHARIDLKKDDCGCGKSKTTDNITIASKIAIESQNDKFQPYLCYALPDINEIKQQEIFSSASINFELNRTEINPRYMNNNEELNKIKNFMNELNENKNIAINSIRIIGYASPEGTVDKNLNLAKGRAKSLRHYISQQNKLRNATCKEEYIDQNWAELKQVVEKSDMKYKNQVLDLIANVAPEINYKTNTSLKKSLMDLKGGEPWRYMTKEFYPSLRKATYTIEYKIENYKLDQIRDIAQTNPESLSVEELLVLADTYDKESMEFKNLIETVVNLYPTDEIANLNAAIAALDRSDYSNAEFYLNRISADNQKPEYNNALGILHMLKNNDPQRAKQYFELAAKAGLEQAKQNIVEINRISNNY